RRGSHTARDDASGHGLLRQLASRRRRAEDPSQQPGAGWAPRPARRLGADVRLPRLPGRRARPTIRLHARGEEEGPRAVSAAPRAAASGRRRGGLTPRGVSPPRDYDSPAKRLFLMMAWTPQLPSTTWVIP